MKPSASTFLAAAFAVALPLSASAAEPTPAPSPAAKPAAAAAPAAPAAKPPAPAPDKAAAASGAAAAVQKDLKPMAKDPNYPVVVLKTAMGDVKIKLDKAKAPITVDNFLKYVDAKFYDGTIFHRTIDNFMVQGGGFDKERKQKPTNAPIKNEAGNGLKNLNYTIAMARTGVVDSATAQFFINVKDNAFLDHRDDTAQGFGYCVFGEVVEGRDVVDKLKAVKVRPPGAGALSEAEPVELLVIDSIRRE